MRHVIHGFLATLIVIVTTFAFSAEVPATLGFQAFLTDNAGAPINQMTPIVFALYHDETGGSPAWSEALNVAVDHGLLSVELGGGAVLFPPDLFAAPLWLGIAVGGDEAMSPRRAITSTAFAIRAADADKIGGISAEDLLAFSGGGGIPPGSRIAVVDLNVTGLNVDLSGLNMALDGRSVQVLFQSMSQPLFAPLVLDYVYPLGSPSPLGLTAGTAVLFADFDILVADDAGYAVQLSGSDVVTQQFTSAVVDDAGTPLRMGGTQWIHESVALQGDFALAFPTAPDNAGPLEVTISRPGSNDTFRAAGRGPLTSKIDPSGPGQAGPAQSAIVLQGIGPAEFDLLQTNYADSEEISLTMRLSGIPLPSGADCRLASFDGMSPTIINEGPNPIATVQLDEITFACSNLGAP